MMAVRTAEVEFSISSLAMLLRAARVKVIERLSFDRIIRFCKSRGAILFVWFHLIKSWVLFGIFWFFDKIDVNPALSFVAIARRFEAVWSLLGAHSWFL